MALIARNLVLGGRRDIVQIFRCSLFTRSDKNVANKNSGIFARMFGKNEPPPEPPVKSSLFSRLFFRQKPKQRGRSWFKLGALAGGGSVIGVMYTIRKYRDSLVLDLRPLHPDKSEAR